MKDSLSVELVEVEATQVGSVSTASQSWLAVGQLPFRCWVSHVEVFCLVDETNEKGAEK